MGACIGKLNKQQSYPRAVIRGKRSIKLKEIRDKYTYVRVIGQGGFSIVRLAYNKNKENSPRNYVAVKSISKESIESTRSIMRELEILKEVDHPNIINFFEIYEDARYFHLVMEYCEGGDLIDTLIARNIVSENIISRIIFKLLSAVNYLNNINIVHRDLKPDNILLLENSTDSDIKLIDFGLC
mmetsp:Transcript_1479/g.158  ORF Transcript_1479/g.158 Transcript_1479/m.158 type:complete len:184 (+) Transcript_1479:33-584(+)